MPLLTISIRYGQTGEQTDPKYRKTLLLRIIERQFRDSMAVTAEASADDKD